MASRFEKLFKIKPKLKESNITELNVKLIGFLISYQDNDLI